MRTVDLNCDMGEGYPNDAELMKCISSANIACGFHAGDAVTMRTTVELALENHVAIGAHPGYRDRENFGRVPMSLTSRDVFDIVLEQVSSLKQICKTSGGQLHHVKAHGALYNQAAKDAELAAAIAEAVAKVDTRLVLFGLSGSCMIAAAEAYGLRSASEVFADRTYRNDGSLTPRTEPNALIEHADESVKQVMQMIGSQSVTTVTGETIVMNADTVCIHGDGAHAVEFALDLRRKLEESGITIQPI